MILSRHTWPTRGSKPKGIGSSSMSSSLYLLTAHFPRLYLGAIIYPHVHAPKYILHRLSRSCTDQSFLSCATHKDVLSLDVAKGRRYSPENSPAIFIRGGEPWLMGYCWRRCFRFGRKVTRRDGLSSPMVIALPAAPVSPQPEAARRSSPWLDRGRWRWSGRRGPAPHGRSGYIAGPARDGSGP
jgi:hypothetical protein